MESFSLFLSRLIGVPNVMQQTLYRFDTPNETQTPQSSPNAPLLLLIDFN
jgi:hypothetical protein